MNEIVKILNVCKTYSMGTQKKTFGKNDSSAQVQALKGVSAVIEKGEFTAIAGPSGSGKTTLLNLIGSLDSITSGDIFVDGKSLAKMSKKQKTLLRCEKIGFIFQSYNLIPVLTAQENVELDLLLLNRFSKEEIKEK